MAMLKIARMGHPILRQVALPVPDPKSLEIQGLIRDMMETLEDCGGIGLAAPQVHVSLRVVVYGIPGERLTEEHEDRAEMPQGIPQGIPMSVLINPRIEPLGEGFSLGFEACLSVPGLMGQVPRWNHIRLSAQDGAGEFLEREVHGFHARVLQHECDHLDGILYPQRMIDLTTLAFAEEARRFAGQAAEDGGV